MRSYLGILCPSSLLFNSADQVPEGSGIDYFTTLWTIRLFRILLFLHNSRNCISSSLLHSLGIRLCGW